MYSSTKDVEQSDTPTETTRLLMNGNDHRDNDDDDDRRHPKNRDDPSTTASAATTTTTTTHRTRAEQSAVDFYFPPHNPTVQRYYRFTSTTLTPIAALHRRPGGGGNGNGTTDGTKDHTASSSSSSASASVSSPPGGVTGLLRRSAVVPSHGTSHGSDDWILVSVGGRSGWARKQKQQQQQHKYTTDDTSASAVAMGGGMDRDRGNGGTDVGGGGGLFVAADTFRATEAWMGNHFFLWNGKCMLGSDAASLVMTNGLIVVGAAVHFVSFLPKLTELAHEHRATATTTTTSSSSSSIAPWWTLDFLWNRPTALFWISAILTIATLIALWWVALTDPGIIPAVSSPIKPPVPTDGPLGGASGYRYCSTCNIFRPPRSKHCNACNCCVSKFDHHCTYLWFWFCLFVVVCCCLLLLVVACLCFFISYGANHLIHPPSIFFYQLTPSYSCCTMYVSEPFSFSTTNEKNENKKKTTTRNTYVQALGPAIASVRGIIGYSSSSSFSCRCSVCW